MIFVNHPVLAREVLILRPHAFVAVQTQSAKHCGSMMGIAFWLRKATYGDNSGGFCRRASARNGCALTHMWRLCRREKMLCQQWPSVGAIRSGEEIAKLCTNTLFRIVLGTELPAHLADSMRVVLHARAVEAGKAIAAEHPQTTGTTPGSDQALARVQRFLDQLIGARRQEPEDQEDILSMLVRP